MLLPSFRAVTACFSSSATRTAASHLVSAFLVAASVFFFFSRDTSAVVRLARGRSTTPGVSVVRLWWERSIAVDKKRAMLNGEQVGLWPEVRLFYIASENLLHVKPQFLAGVAVTGLLPTITPCTLQPGRNGARFTWPQQSLI
jgi:hypothetical protein